MSFFNISGFHSPPSRPLIVPSPTSPFCTSPSQLQEVTLDQDNTFSNSMGLRSPGGPMRGRSVKEFEEQLANLKKENFNLKLRIYFLEERMGVNFNLDKENIVKKNVELMVEVESLRKEVQEKHELLCQAVKAMELEDEEHKKLLSEKDEAISECQQEIENLKTQLIDMKAENEVASSRSNQSGPTEFYSSQAFTLSENTIGLKELQDKIQALQEELGQEKENNAAIQIVLDQNDSKINSLGSQLEEANKKLSSRDKEQKDMNFRLEEALGKCQSLHKKLQEKTQLADELSSEIEQFRKRQSLFSGDLEKERKRYEKLKASSDQKISELQCKLEASLAELKKSQELVVSNTLGGRSGHTDPDSFSVQKPTTPPGSPQKDTFLLPPIPSPVITPDCSPSSSISFAVDSTKDLKHIIEQLKTERDAQHQKIVKLKAEQMKACKIIKSMIESQSKTNEEIATLKQKNNDLEQELEGVVSKGKASDKKSNVSARTKNVENENSMDPQNEELIEHYKILTDELDEKNRILMATLTEKNNQMKKLQEQYEEMLKNIKEKEEHIVDLEFELLAQNGNFNCKDDEKKAAFYIQQLKEKDVEIERLNTKLLKKNCDLQGLVNNELWEKNREIEKLQKKQSANMFTEKDREIEKLQSDLKTKEKQLELIVTKISDMGIDLNIENGDGNIENNLQIELEKSEKLRAEANEVCGVLSGRLEELAIFLDSLLKQKSVLGFLGNKENKRLRQIIDQSLDLSRSFTMSMIIHPEQSLMQLTNISSLLNNTESPVQADDNAEESSAQLTLIPTNVSMTYHSHLYKRNEENTSKIIQTLREQIVNLKYELQLRDVELNKINAYTNFTDVSSDKEEVAKCNLNTTSTTLKYKSDNQSESEAWSEPDRTVSRARIGLESSPRSNSTVKPVSNTSDSTEDEELDRSSKMSKKGIVDSRSTILELHKQVCKLDEKLNDKEVAYFEAVKMSNRLKQEMTNLEIKLNDTEMKLQEAEAKKEIAENNAKQLQKEKNELLESLTKKDKELQDKINEIEIEKCQALDTVQQAEQDAVTAKNEMKAVERKLNEMNQKVKHLEETLKSDYQNQLIEKIQLLETKSMEQISEIQKESEEEIKCLEKTIEQLRKEYSTNYVRKCELLAAVEENERLSIEIMKLGERIEEMKEDKDVLRNKLMDYEEKNNILRNNLDNATLQYSEAVLEKTKIANERALIEQELSRSALKEVDTKNRLEQVENELYELRQNHQKQMSVLQTHKSQLEVRISELESSNAELHYKLVKIQAGCGDHLSTATSCNTTNFVNQIVSFRRQHSDNSCYLSEEQVMLDNRVGNRNFSRLVPSQNFEVERNEANSSPDLGIESDHGRFSSLETHLNVTRPLLQTLELTESMNNLLDAENKDMQAVDCVDAHCCEKTLQMAQENSDLRRKLLRTRRALEETVTQLTLANQRKKQVEKTICKQIHKTSQVLRKAKANLDSGSETDVLKN